ncbi:hypothetical protein RRG08_010748, partial [Elysia crispata]
FPFIPITQYSILHRASPYPTVFASPPRTQPEMCLFGAPRALLLLCPPPPVIGKVRFQSSDYNRACALAILTTSEPAS